MTDSRAPVPKSPHKKVGLIFLAIAIIAVVTIQYLQRSLAAPSGWIDNDLPEAMRQAKQRSANIVVLFVAKPPTEIDRWITTKTLSEEANMKALEDGNFVAVMVRVSGNQRAQYAEEFSVHTFPTTLILSPDGEELNRKEGKIGETDFRDVFLVAAARQ